MAPDRTLCKRSRSQNACPYTSGLDSVATSAQTPLSGYFPTSITHHFSPSNRVSPPVPGHRSASPLGGVTREVQEDPLGTRARGRKRGGDGQEIWPIHLEEVFLQGLIEYEDLNPPCDELGVDKRRWEHRNHWLSEYILQKTGVLRRRKQVGSRMQTLKKSWKGTARFYLVCSPYERRRAVEPKGQPEISHTSVSDFPRAVPPLAGNFAFRPPSSHAQYSGSACSVLNSWTTRAPSPFWSSFNSLPRPHQLAFLLWDGVRHLCLLRYSDLRPSTKSLIGPNHSVIVSLATPHPVVIQAPTDRLTSELCLPFGGQYYPLGSGVAITVFADCNNTPLHRSEYYLDGRDSRTVKVDIVNCVIRILCMENFLEERFHCPGTEGEVLTIIAELVDDLSSPQRQVIQVLLFQFQFQAVQPGPLMTTSPIVMAPSVITQPTSYDLGIAPLTGSVGQEHQTLYTADPCCLLRSDPHPLWHPTPTSPSSISTTSLGDLSFTTDLSWEGTPRVPVVTSRS